MIVFHKIFEIYDILAFCMRDTDNIFQQLKHRYLLSILLEKETKNEWSYSGRLQQHRRSHEVAVLRGAEHMALKIQLHLAMCSDRNV